MISPSEYFKGFQVNHFDYKQLVNKHLLELKDEEIYKLINTVIDGNKEEFLRSVKMDVRLTFLLSVETLFELIFSLLPENGGVDDRALMYKLARKEFNNKDIRDFVNGKASRLDDLKKELEYPDGKKNDILQHIFYFNLRFDKYKDQVKSSLEVIEKTIKTLASELSDREELNCYKHGFRSVPMWKSISVINAETNDRIKFDLNDSVTIFSQDEKKGTFEVLTKTLDPIRDIELTNQTSKLISNIINPRKILANPQEGRNVMFHFFDENSLQTAKKVNVDASKIKFTGTLEKNEKESNKK